MDRAPLRLIVDTPIGVLIRTIPNASPLRGGVLAGAASEIATTDAAAVWGLPDFVYRGQIRRVGSGLRELGDGLLLVGDLGIVVQVKCRAAPTEDETREGAWIEKQIARALQQAEGTVRLLKREPALLTNARGRSVEIDGNAFRWACVVVIDHSAPPDDVLPDIEDATNPAVVLFRRDWEFLFDQLKSTHAVAAYLARVAGDSVVLGEEPIRYFKLAGADHEATPGPIDPRLLGDNGRMFSTPTLPLRRAASEDRSAHLLLRSVFEDIATSDLRGAPESNRLRVLAELDRLPVGDRDEIGRFLMSSLKMVTAARPAGVEWRFRRIVGSLPDPPRPIHLGFGACSGSTRLHRDVFSTWVQLRHFQVQQVVGRGRGLVTIGVLLTPRSDGNREWDTTLTSVGGDIDFTEDDVSELVDRQATFAGFRRLQPVALLCPRSRRYNQVSALPASLHCSGFARRRHQQRCLTTH